MTQMPVPKLNAMLVCDYVITEHGTNKKSLIGIFENINATKFPCVHFGLTLYLKMTETRGRFKVRLQLVDLKNEKVIAKTETPREISVADPRLTHELVFNLKGIAFPHAGDYEFRVYANDKIFGQKCFRVVDRSRKNKT